MNRTADAIIVGAGVIGSAVAFELAKRGYKTLNIDKLPTSDMVQQVIHVQYSQGTITRHGMVLQWPMKVSFTGMTGMIILE